jgi:hypothetical protein
MTEAKAFRTFIRTYSLFRNERLSTNIKLTLHKPQITSAKTYACLTYKARFSATLETLKGTQISV